MNIYVKLLNEGSIVYRPVPAKRVTENIYELEGYDIYDPEDEKWEFCPGTKVIVEQKVLEKESVLVAKMENKQK